MTLGVSDLQSDSDLDSIRNSCDVYYKSNEIPKTVLKIFFNSIFVDRLLRYSILVQMTEMMIFNMTSLQVEIGNPLSMQWLKYTNMSHSQMLGKVESGGGPIFKVVLEC